MNSIPTAPDVVVTIAHVRSVPYFTRSAGFCASGSRAWFDRHGLDFRAFVKDGLPASVLEATGCGIALALVRWARTEAGRE